MTDNLAFVIEWGGTHDFNRYLQHQPGPIFGGLHNLDRLLGDEPHEFIGIHDAKSLCEGYNRGISQSRGQFIIACHDDIEILAGDFRQRLLSRLNRFDLLGLAGSTRLGGAKWTTAGPPHVFGQVAHFHAAENYYKVAIWGVPARCISGIQIMDGLFLAGRRAVFEAVPFDQETFRDFHLYDMDFTFRAAKSGFKLAVCADFAVIHASLGEYNERWNADAERFLAKHRADIRRVPGRWWSHMQVKVYDKNELIELMQSPYWADE